MSLHSSHPFPCTFPTLQVGKKLTCRLHLSELMDLKEGSLPGPGSNPLAGFKVQQPVEAVVLGRLAGQTTHHR